MAAHADLERTFAGHEAPFAFLDLDALEANADDLLRRSDPKPVRLASKSIRCRWVVEHVLARHDRFRGVLALTLPEALWLHDHGQRDVVVGYPTVDRAAVATAAERADDDGPVLMVDSTDHLDLVEAAAPAGAPPVPVCLDLEAGLHLLGGRVRVGPKRSPVHDEDDAVALARECARRPSVRLVGLMAYEGQIAGVGDAPGNPLMGAAIRRMQSVSALELRRRRARVVAAVREVADLRFVNGGGTGSLETTAAEAAVTEVAAGSGLYGPHLFDTYRAFQPRPAAGFALPVVRKPSTDVATLLGGGYVASGATGDDRLPQPWQPPGLRYDSQEGAGEAQTPLLGDAARHLRVGDRVYLRHTKAGELCERFASLLLVRGGTVVDDVPTYRGEGQTFL